MLAAARGDERTATGSRHFVWFRVPGAPEQLAALVNSLLSLAGHIHQMREHLAAVDADEPRPEHWYQRDVPVELRDLSLELLEAVPLGADLTGVVGQLGPVLSGWRVYGPVPIRLALEQAGIDPMAALRELREKLAAAPAWAAEVSA